MSIVQYPLPLLARIAALCEANPLCEACGFVVRRRGALEVEPIANVAGAVERTRGRPAALEPPREARTRYVMDPVAQLRLFKELASSGGEVAAVWHSHVDAGASFSVEDRAHARAGGSPVIPGAEYLVFGMRSGQVFEVKRYRFEAGKFVESRLDD